MTVSDTEFTEIKATARTDSRGRITLGEAAVEREYSVSVDRLGRILLTPMVRVPAHEAWLHRNPAAMESVQRGLQQAAEGRVSAPRSFAAYTDIETDD